MRSIEPQHSSTFFRIFVGLSAIAVGVALWPWGVQQPNILNFIPTILCTAVVGIASFPVRGIVPFGFAIAAALLCMNFFFVRVEFLAQAILFELSVFVLLFGGDVLKMIIRRIHKMRLPSQLPQQFRARSCQGKQWKNAFPAASKDEIRSFLTTFAAAFAFRENETLRFSPDDTIMQIYRALYPSKWTPDALEVETLSMTFKSKYGIELESIWHDDLSLGELFAVSRRGALV